MVTDLLQGKIRFDAQTGHIIWISVNSVNLHFHFVIPFLLGFYEILVDLLTVRTADQRQRKTET